MISRLLKELPAPPEGKFGWPWTEETVYIGDNLNSNRVSLPIISIVTPSFNQGEFIEETIRSILLQNYPNLEYIIVDGGSDDGTIDVINKYKKWIDVVISEKDSGQSDAINKGLRLIKGDIFNWINSDDFLDPGALFNVAEACISQPDKKVFYFNRNMIYEDGSEKIEEAGDLFDDAIVFCNPPIIQQGIFYTAEAVKKMGELSTILHYTMDYDWWLRFLFLFGKEKIFHEPKSIANMRIHGDSKTSLYPAQFAGNVATILYSMCNQLNIKQFTEVLESKFELQPGYEFPTKINPLQKELVNRMLSIFLLKQLNLVFTKIDYQNARIISKIDWNKMNLNDSEKKWLENLKLNVAPSNWIFFRIRRKLKYLNKLISAELRDR
ncbi:MAG: glycosyltransferase [Melioribacteraceae bacterium]|nr:glycosyltransferase [Melioribacteraceae bacterium]MCF8262872.1 glycosyltransferase [Melioribacteraceae bacterium]MCF8430900.1 glycosyltransferase [Melioribacteraceae bacterium]